jgi:hypothetical protein
MTNGPIKRSNKPWQLGPFKTKKGIKRGGKKKNHSGSTFRDYRGIDGVLEDAQKGKKK